MLAQGPQPQLFTRRAAAVRLQHHQHQCVLPSRLQQQRSHAHTLHTLCRATNTSSGSFSEQAQRFADNAQQKMQDFVKQQRLDEKAAAASKEAQKRIQSWGEETQQNMRRTYMKLESEHNLNQRFSRTKTWMDETVRDIDQEWSVRRRLKTTAEDVQRMLPLWRRQFAQFSASPVGKATLWLAFASLLFTGMLWKLMNAFWLLFWLSIPVSAFIGSQRSKAAAAASAAEEQQQQEQRGPFAGWGSSSRNSSSYGGSSSSSRSSSPYSSDGPIVEAEWVSLDEGDDSGSGSSSKRR